MSGLVEPAAGWAANVGVTEDASSASATDIMSSRDRATDRWRVGRPHGCDDRAEGIRTVSRVSGPLDEDALWAPVRADNSLPPSYQTPHETCDDGTLARRSVTVAPSHGHTTHGLARRQPNATSAGLGPGTCDSRHTAATGGVGDCPLEVPGGRLRAFIEGLLGHHGDP